ncbi:MAG TPA: Ig-like domain-containing protein, partial [Verrucomicrobiae bacterium]
MSTTGSNVGATKQFGQEPFLVGGDFGGASVWWNWTATASGQTTIDTMDSDFNTLLGVFTGNAANQLALVADNNDYNGNTWSRVQFNAVAGTIYRIYVDGVRVGGGPGGRASTGNIVLHIQGVGGLTITTPTNGMVATVGDPIPVAVTIDADFPNPPATRVDFYRAGTLFASSTTAPFSAVSSNAPAGSNSFYVVAFDSTGMPIQSPVVTMFVQSVGVTLLTPFEDTIFFNTNPITVTAHGYLPSGSITNIEFFVDGQKFGEDGSVPFSAVWSNVVSGSHRLTAIGRSDAGASYNSQPVNIGVAQLIVPTNSVWKYLDNGSDQGTAWIAPAFDDSSWASGPAQLGYGDGDEATVVNSGPTNNYYITTYF